MITVKEVDKSFLELYDKVAMNVNVNSEYKVKRINNGLGGFILKEVQVEPYIKDLSSYERATEYENEFDITNWRFYMVFRYLGRFQDQEVQTMKLGACQFSVKKI